MFAKNILSISIIFFGLALFASSASAIDAFEVSVEELGVEKPGIISWFKDAFDSVQIFFAKDPIKKAELELRKANRRVVKIREQLQEQAESSKLTDNFNRLNQDYQGYINQINNRIQQLKDENKGSDQLNGFLDKYHQHQMLHQEILKKLEDQVPKEVYQKIEEKRLEHLERFGEVMAGLQDKEEFKKELGEAVEDVQQKLERRMQRIEIINDLEEGAGQQVKERIQELKQEKEQIFQQVQEQYQEMIQNRNQTGQEQGNQEENSGVREMIKNMFSSGK